MKRHSIKTSELRIASVVVAVLLVFSLRLPAGDNPAGTVSSDGSRGWWDNLTNPPAPSGDGWWNNLTGQTDKGGNLQELVRHCALAALGGGPDLFATVVDRLSHEQMTVSKKPNAQGFRLFAIDWGKMTVTIKKGDQTAEVKLDPALSSAALKNQAAEALSRLHPFGSLTSAQVEGLRQKCVRYDDSIE